MVEDLTDDALDVIVDIVMATSRQLYGCLWGARRYWLDVTDDYWYEWSDRRGRGFLVWGKNDATFTS